MQSIILSFRRTLEVSYELENTLYTCAGVASDIFNMFRSVFSLSRCDDNGKQKAVISCYVCYKSLCLCNSTINVAAVIKKEHILYFSGNSAFSPQKAPTVSTNQ